MTHTCTAQPNGAISYRNVLKKKRVNQWMMMRSSATHQQCSSLKRATHSHIRSYRGILFLYGFVCLCVLCIFCIESLICPPIHDKQYYAKAKFLLPLMCTCTDCIFKRKHFSSWMCRMPCIASMRGNTTGALPILRSIEQCGMTRFLITQLVQCCPLSR